MKSASDKEWTDRFAKTLKERIEYLQITQNELSKRTGIPKNTISMYVNGLAIPRASVIPKLAKGLMLPVQDLIDFRTDLN